MEQISSNEKERIAQFIKDNELDYQIVDNDINKFHVVAHDGFKFFPFNYNEQKLLMTLDPDKKDQFGAPSYNAYTYTQYENLTKFLEFISHYDKSLNKVYWYNIPADDLSYDTQSYNPEWFNDFIKEGFVIDEAVHYKYLSYTNNSYRPKLRSPFNTLHEVSPINSMTYETVNKLNFEIHPVTTKEEKETYLVKLLSNNDEVLKEYINWVVVSRKGLRLFLETLFVDMKRFKVNEGSTISELEERLDLEIEDKDWVKSKTIDMHSYTDKDGSFTIIITTDLPYIDENSDDFYDMVEDYVLNTGIPMVTELMSRFCKKYDYTLIDIEPQDNDSVDRGDSEVYYQVKIGNI